MNSISATSSGKQSTSAQRMGADAPFVLSTIAVLVLLGLFIAHSGGILLLLACWMSLTWPLNCAFGWQIGPGAGAVPARIAYPVLGGALAVLVAVMNVFRLLGIGALGHALFLALFIIVGGIATGLYTSRQ